MLLLLLAWQLASPLHAGPALSSLERLCGTEESGVAWDGAASRPVESEASAAGTVQPLPRNATEQTRVRPGSGGAFVAVPGSIFDFKPAAESPGHGFPPIDALIRRLLSREDRRFQDGFEFTDAGPERADVFLYGERHSDGPLIAENMRRLTAHLRPGRGAIVLDEGYLGPRLFGHEAAVYLAAKGFDPDAAPQGAALEIRGWEDPELYRRSNRASMRESVDALELNHLIHGPERGLEYYRTLAAKLWESYRSRRQLRRLAIGERNRALDAALAEALADAAEDGRTVHVIAGAEHLVEHPLLSGLPLLGRGRLREGLREAVGGRRYWAAKPPERPAASAVRPR